MWPRHTAQSRLPADFTSDDLPLQVRFGGHRTMLNWLQPDDTARLIAFFASDSEETLYERYGYAGVRMTADKAAELVSVDQSRDAALGVFEECGSDSRLIGIGRYCLEADGRGAEAAFVVHEERRCLGIGATLLSALTTIANERNLECLVAEVRQDNAPMIHLLHAAGATFESIAGTSALHAALRIHPTRSLTKKRGTSLKSKIRPSWIANTVARAALRLEQTSIDLQKLPMP